MPDPRPIFTITSQPGIQRDGTVLDSQAYTDGQWVRFQRGKARKMGGYRTIAEDLPFIPRGAQGYYSDNNMYLYAFGEDKCRIAVAAVTAPFTTTVEHTFTELDSADYYTYQSDSLYDQTGVGSIIVAHGARNVDDIASTTNTPVFYGFAGTSTPGWTTCTDYTASPVSVSGGVCVLQPFVFVYGNSGLIKNSNANDPNDWEIRIGGEANEANVSAHKIVKGMAMRGSGNAPAGLFWALDSLIRVSFVGGSAVWRYDVLSNQTSILSPHSVIEYDGVYYWIGLDRFLMFNGNVQEIPNTTNLNFFFDSLSFPSRAKVWAMKVPKYGEIWWFFPKDGATECNHAIILNVREKVWYDVELSRSAGVFSQLYQFPIMYGNEFIEAATAVAWAAQVGTTGTAIYFPAEASTVTGFYTGGTIEFLNGTAIGQIRTITDYDGGTLKATVSAFSPAPTVGDLFRLVTTDDYTHIYAHEYGQNAVDFDSESIIPAHVTTHDFGLPTGSVAGESPQGQDYWTRLTRVEPDMTLTGDMLLTVIGQEFANSPETESSVYTFDNTTTKIDMREQHRHIRLKFESADLNGDFEMGRVLLHTEPGDIRS